MTGRGRGRGRAKTTSTRPTENELNEKGSTEEHEVVQEKKKTTKKKQFPVVAVVSPEGIEGNLMNTRSPLIVHFPIQSRKISMNDMPIHYDPLPPLEAEPYDIDADNPFCNTVEQIELDTKEDSTLDAVKSNTSVNMVVNNTVNEIDYYTMKSTLLVQFKNSSEVKKIPETSDAACFWCCYTFTHRPVVLPIRDTGEHLIVTGNFCCPECTVSYLFDMRQDSHTRWEQLALIYRVYSEACKGKIHPAPPKSILKLFGGNLSIEEYRGLIQSYKVRVDLHLPPMVSILATMDTKPVDFYDSGLTKNVNETIKERLQKAEEVLRLRRTKPLKAWESTLDACINLKIGGGR
jgi:hypothetical protein